MDYTRECYCQALRKLREAKGRPVILYYRAVKPNGKTIATFFPAEKQKAIDMAEKCQGMVIVEVHHEEIVKDFRK